MAIMVGGGLTFAIPGMEPAHAQSSNLTVSADGLGGNEITDINIIEVIVRDRDIDESTDSAPIVIVDDNTVLTMRFFSGSWYGYFASDEIGESGLVPTTDDSDPPEALTEAVIRQSIDDLVRGEPARLDPAPLGAPTLATDDGAEDLVTTGDPLVTLYTLDGKFDIVYKKPANEQTVTLDLDDPDSGVSLDRSNYPQNTGVAITIDDMAFNVDPTSEDVWFLVDGSSTARYADADNAGNVATIAAAQIDKDAKIAAAEKAKMDAVDNAEAEEKDLLARAETARQAFVDEAREARDNLIAAAQAIIDNPLLDNAEDRPEFGDNTSANGVIGTGVAVEFDGGDDDVLFENYSASVGTAQITYEGVAGRGDKTSDDTENPNYKGTAQIAYEGVVGRGDKTSDETGDLHYEGSAKTTRDGVGGDEGSANVAYEWVVGRADANGDPGTDLRETTASETRPTEGHAGTAQIEYLTAITADGDADVSPTNVIKTPDIEISGVFETFNINDARSLTECSTNDCAIIGDKTWMKFTEVDKNDSEFDNTSDDVPSLQTMSNAQRGLNFSIEYDNTETAGIGYSTTTIAIDDGGDWMSGQAATVTLTDSDANTNSLTENDLEVTNADQIIPTIKIGDPFTLAEAESSDKYMITDVSDILVFKEAMTYNTGEKLTIKLGKWSDVNDYLPQHEPSFTGIHMLNYDLSALEKVDGISLKIGTASFPLVSMDNYDSDGRDGRILTDASFNATTDTFGKLYDEKGNIKDFGTDKASLEISFSASSTVNKGDAIIVDLFSFGLEDKTDSVNNAIYRLELEEANSNSSDFTGTLEYVALTQMNVWENSTYNGITPIGADVVLISDDDSVSVEYRDLDSTGGYTTFTAKADTPTHSGSVSLDADGYKVSDTVTVTVEDADLNADSGKADVYTAYEDKISSSNAVMELFSISINDELWADACGLDQGLEDSEFTLQETGSATGIFIGTFAVPAQYCDDSKTAATVTGTDISAKYTDFRDDSGSTISVSASAGIRSTTASVSLDRTVYPVPFSGSSYETHSGENLPAGALTVYVSIDDADFDTSSNGIDEIEIDGNAPLTVSIIRGSESRLIDMAGNATEGAIEETEPDSGIFEHELTIEYGSTVDNGDDSLSSSKCPVGSHYCILQGDILHVTYNDPSDASGSSNTVTDSATFDLRNAVLQSDQTAYIIGSGMILTLIEQDLNLDSGATETYPLTLIEWDSDAGTEMLSNTAFDATPSNLLETGTDTGIFQVVVTIPPELGDDDDKLERGEEITLEYVDWGPSGADHVGDKDQSITTTVYTSNFGATIELDQRVYTWTDKVYVTVVAPDHNIDSDQVDEIGNDDDYPIRVSTRGNEIENYKLVETGADTGIFTGEVILTGFEHNADGEPGFDADGRTSLDGSGPTDGLIGTESESGISVSFKYSEGETVSSSALIRWNVGEVQWLEASYPASGSGIVRVIDPDMNLNPEAVDNFDVTVWSDSDGGGIDLTVTETNAATGIFEGTVFFGVGVDTSGHRLRVVEGDTVTAQYYDNTLPAPFKETERVRVGATTLIGTIVPPLERVPISDLRAVDSFGSTLDTISVDSQIQLAADLTNGQDKSQDFAYLIQIQDENGVTVSLDWIAGSLTEGQSLSPASSWTPTEAGTYEVTAFAWESIENPTALSPTSTIAITVN